MIYCFAPPRTVKMGLLLQSGYMLSLCTEFTSPEAMERLGHEAGKYPTPEKGKQIRGIRRGGT
jgi:hypothetical protein